MSYGRSYSFSGCGETSNLASAICSGEAGSGKTRLAQLQKDKHRRVITLSLVVSDEVRPHGSLPTITRLNRPAP